MNIGYVLPFAVGILLMIDHGMTINHFPRIYHHHSYYPNQHIYRRQYNIPAENDTTAVGFSRNRRGVTAERAAELQRMRMKNLQGMEQELLVMLNIDSKWEQYLMPGPMAVATLGQLIVISTKRDFKLQNVNLGKFKYLRHTHFRPALIQVANAGWKAFRLANRNMERIKLSMAELPRNVKQALRFLGSPKPEIISKFLPIPLDAIEQTSNECVQYAIEIDDVFINMVELLGEVDEALAATHGYYREGLLNITREKEIAEEERKFLAVMHQQVKKEFGKVSKQLDEDRSKYEKALKKIPTGWKAVFQDVVRGINPMQIAGMFMGGGGALSGMVGGKGGSAGGALGGITGKLGGSLGGGKGGLSDILGKVGGKFKLGGVLKGFLGGKFNKDKSDDPIPKDGAVISDHNLNQEHALNHAENVFRALDTIDPELSEFLGVWGRNGAKDAKTKKHRKDLIGFMTAKKEGGVSLKETLSTKGDSPWKAPAMHLLDRYIEATSFVISKLEESEEVSHEAQEAIRNKIPTFKSIQKEAEGLVSVRSFKSGGISSRQIVSSKTPSGKQTGTGSGERYIAAQRQATLYETQRRYDEFYDRVVKANKELNKVMRHISRLNIQEADFKEIAAIIEEGISAIANLKKQFDRMIRFFQIVSAVTSVTLQKTAKSFLAIARTLGYSPETVKEFLHDDPTFAIRDTLVGDASRIATVSKFLFTLSDVYVTVSNKHIMDPLATASGLQTVEENQRNAKLKELFDKAKASQSDILKIVDAKRKAFKRAVAKSKSEIEEMFRSLGKPSKEQMQQIEAAKTVVNVQTELEASPYAPSCLVGC